MNGSNFASRIIKNDQYVFSFEQNSPIPSFLFSIVVGNFSSKKIIGDKVIVIADKNNIDEFSGKIKVCFIF